MPAQVEDAKLRAAFRALHGPRLHGFALLVARGEAEAAERARVRYLPPGSGRPRRSATRSGPLPSSGRELSAGCTTAFRCGTPTPVPSSRATVTSLGVDGTGYEGLAVLSDEGRAALVASAIERFEPMDTETILGASPAAARRLIAQARDRYLQVVEGQSAGQSAGQSGLPPTQPEGVLAMRIREIASRAISPGWKAE